MLNHSIESITSNILKELNIRTPSQIDVYKISKYLGVDVKAENMDFDISGLFVIKNNKPHIRYNKNEHPNRKRFTIAHELGHVALGHSRKRMIDFSGQNAMRVALMMILNRFLPGFGAIIANFLTTLLAAKLSRKDEYEADAYASALLTKSNIGVKGQKDLLSKLDKISNSAGAMPVWLLSHPKAKERINAIETLEKKWSK